MMINILQRVCDMADRKLGELLTEFQNLAESEHQAGVDTIVSRHENKTTIFSALALLEVSHHCHVLQYQ